MNFEKVEELQYKSLKPIAVYSTSAGTRFVTDADMREALPVAAYRKFEDEQMLSTQPRIDGQRCWYIGSVRRFFERNWPT